MFTFEQTPAWQRRKLFLIAMGASVSQSTTGVKERKQPFSWKRGVVRLQETVSAVQSRAENETPINDGGFKASRSGRLQLGNATVLPQLAPDAPREVGQPVLVLVVRSPR
jgi:hypothetical protein